MLIRLSTTTTTTLATLRAEPADTGPLLRDLTAAGGTI